MEANPFVSYIAAIWPKVVAARDIRHATYRNTASLSSSVALIGSRGGEQMSESEFLTSGISMVSAPTTIADMAMVQNI